MNRRFVGRRIAGLLLGLAALFAGAAQAACQSGLAERMHARLYPQRALDTQLAACQTWPGVAGRSIVLLPMRNPERANEFDIELLVIQRPDNGNTERDVVLSRLYQPRALRQSKLLEIEDIRIDSSRWALARDVRGFGLRIRWRNAPPSDPASRESFSLYALQGKRLRQVLDELTLSSDSGEWGLDCRGRYAQLRSQLSVADSGSSQGYADLSLLRTQRSRVSVRLPDGECSESAGPTRTRSYPLRYDNGQYRLPKALRGD